MSIAHAEKEIRALARKLGVKPFLVRDAVKALSVGEIDVAPTTALANRRQVTGARMATRADMAPRDPVKKEHPVEHEAYRRLVAGRPCMHCGIAGRSQAAHENAGKGKGMKTDDRRTFPLCADGPIVLGCHTRFDRYQLAMSRAEHVAMGAQWSRKTREAIRAEGLWPADLEYLE